MAKPEQVRTEVAATATVTPKRVFSEQVVLVDDVFKLGAAPMKKNISYQKYKPKLEDVEHCHIFHRVDMKGQLMTYCHPVGGHFHEVKVGLDPKTGEFRAECGPPLRKVQVKTRAGTFRTEIQPVEFEDDVNGKTIVDDHRHEVRYLRSQNITAEDIKAQQAVDSQKLQMLQAGGSGIRGSVNGGGATSAGGATIQEVESAE